MHWPLVAVMFAAGASAQTLIDPGQISSLIGSIPQRSGGARLRGSMWPSPPILDFAFRFRAGYSFRLDAGQYPPGRHSWSVLTKVTPQDGAAKPAWLFLRFDDFEVGAGARGEFAGHGNYLLGPGRYMVDSTLYDELGRSCQYKWRVDTRLAPDQRGIHLSMPPFAVRDFPGVRAADWKPAAASAGIAILVNADPFVSPRTGMERDDRDFLILGLTAIAGRVPAASLRLVLFSLDEKKEIFRNDAFSIDAVDGVAQAIDALRPGTVRAADPVEFLAGLINRESRAPGPPSTVILLGSSSRTVGKFPEGILKAPAGAGFFYVKHILPPAGRSQPSMDIIDSAMNSLRGRTLAIRAPADLAKAIAAVQKTR
jgi:hypothetical protein